MEEKVRQMFEVQSWRRLTVIVHGIMRSPIMLEQTNIRRHTTGTHARYVAPSPIQIVHDPEMNMHTAIQKDDSITRKRRLKRLRRNALRQDMMKRTTPRKIEATNGSMPPAPMS
jgi:hypothetical protein